MQIPSQRLNMNQNQLQYRFLAAMRKSKYIDSDEEEEQFVMKKAQKKTTKSSTSKSRKKKQDDDDYVPKVQVEKSSSDPDLKPSSEDELPKKSQKKSRATTKVKQEDVNERQEVQESQIEIHKSEEFYEQAEKSLPAFLQPERIRDSEGRRPDDPNYDKTTIHIPIDQYQKLSPMFKQYWNAKMHHFDAIVYFRCGRWNTVMYSDAILIARQFNRYLGFWGKDRPCVTVYDSQLPLYSRVLLEKGYKICQVEQLEKVDLAQKKQDGEIARREITQIISKGTQQEVDSYESKNLMVICETINTIQGQQTYMYGIAICDCTTNEFYMDQFEDDEHSNQLRTLLYKARPQEIILKARPEIEKLIRSVCQNPVIIQSNKEPKDIAYCFNQFKKEFMDSKTKTQFEGIIQPTKEIEPEVKVLTSISDGIIPPQDDEEKQKVKLYLNRDYPDIFQQFEKQYNFEMKKFKDEEQYSYYHTVQAFYILLSYLRQLIQSDTVYRRGQFQLLDSNYNSKLNLHLDCQALESLEIFQVNLQTRLTTKGSLFEYLDKCSTMFGKRLLKKWIESPAYQVSIIKQRQACIQDLIKNIEIVDEVAKRLRQLPDIERSIIKLFNTIQSSKLKAVALQGGETFGMLKLRDMSQLLKQLHEASEIPKIFVKYISKFKSERLIKLVTIDQLFPDISETIRNLEKCLVIKDNQAHPTQGVSKAYDQAAQALQEIMDTLDEELNKWRKKLSCPKIQYYHGKMRYQLEIPDEYITQKPKEFTISSKKKGFQRFYTTFIEEQIHNLRVAEDELQKQLVPFLNAYLQQFFGYRKELYQLISCLSELDCLCSLSLVSISMKGCVPDFVEIGPEGGIFELKSAVHPCLQGDWVPNDVSFDKELIMLTGPNMSGKSTLLRMVGVQIIMAQIGCNVPAKSFTLNPIDRIFCRLGAQDRILEGKSTFFVELEETKVILEHATSQSLVIIDELGRGTSTYDGVAIASSVLKYLANKITPRTLFATHYHILLDEFQHYSNIKPCVMKHYSQNDKVTFEYKLIEGFAQKSFAANVASIAGIPDIVVHRALQLEHKITKEEQKINKNRAVLQQYNSIVANLLD